MALDLPALHARLLATAPLIQNITNTVVQQFSANVLLAVGAAPAMLDHEADAGQFAALADAILVNFGTATNQQLLAADAAIRVARALHKPWVLDPVSIGVIDYRSTRIRQAAEQQPTVIRGNASEIAALAGLGTGGRGVDSTDEVDAVLTAALSLAQTTGAVVAVSGPRDAVVEASGSTVRVARLGGGHALMPRVVGTGCSLGSLTAAYLAACCKEGASAFDATIAAHAHFKLAGQAAGQQAQGPGSFIPAFLDALYALPSAAMTKAEVHIEVREMPDLCGL
ncbi:hydroxyethylthiazole kinase [Castellaniella caeni]|uniref:hydroxyethylthiazole kinase n=1 Tax=Castellaniella caeni TaxID=266123 RepID=UPI0008333E8C|nr:hydroxyethylthiazole kinase [Castellaniella caeni]